MRGRAPAVDTAALPVTLRGMDITAAVAKDHRLESRHDSASLALMEHRHRCVAEFGATAYARELGRSDMTVRAYARAWELWQGATAGGRSPSDCLELARMGEDKRTATEAVAEAKGLSVKHVSRHYGPEVDRARRAMDLEPDTGRRADAAREFARRSEKIAAQDRERTRERRASTPRAYLDLERSIDRARRALVDALATAREANLDSEYVTLVTDSLDKTRSVLALIDLAITGAIEVDWDAELAKVVNE